MAVYKQFIVDIDIRKALTNKEFSVVEGDTGNILIINVTDDGAPVDLTGTRICLVFSRGKELAMQDNTTEQGGVHIEGDDNNIVVVDLFNGSFSAGLVEAIMQIYSGENFETLITTARFNFRCERSLLSDETIMSLQQYSVLNALIQQVQDLVLGVQSDFDEQDSTKPAFIKNKPTEMTPTPHAASHAMNGADPITPAMIGAMEDGAAPTEHATSHASGGSDPITPASIGAASTNHHATHGIFGSDPITPADIGAQAAGNYEPMKSLFTDVSVPVASWVADGDLYVAEISLIGVTATMIPDVAFGMTDAISGNFTPVAESYSGGVKIWAYEVPEAEITIPTIILWGSALK